LERCEARENPPKGVEVNVKKPAFCARCREKKKAFKISVGKRLLCWEKERARESLQEEKVPFD